MRVYEWDQGNPGARAEVAKLKDDVQSVFEAELTTHIILEDWEDALVDLESLTKKIKRLKDLYEEVDFSP